MNKLFGWGNEVVKKAVGKLVESGTLANAEHPKRRPPQEHRDDASVSKGQRASGWGWGRCVSKRLTLEALLKVFDNSLDVKL